MSAFPKTMHASPRLSHCSTTSQNFTILTQELRSQTLTGHRICDTAELWFKVTAYLCDGSLQYRARDFAEKYSSPSESSCSTEQLCTPHPWPAQLPQISLRSQLPAYVLILCPRFGETLTTRPPSHLDAHGHNFFSLENYTILSLHEYNALNCLPILKVYSA